MDLDINHIVALARPHLRNFERVHYAPHIPYRKERNVRQLHGIPSDEPIAVLYDDTAWGGAKDGFVVTPRRVAWRCMLDTPHQIPTEDLAAAEITSGAHGVSINDEPLSLVLFPNAERRAVAEFLQAMGRGRRTDQQTHPFRDAPGPVGASPAGTRNPSREQVLTLAERLTQRATSTFVAPYIADAKIRSVLQIHAGTLPFDEEVLVLHDNTVFGNAEDGWLATTERLCWKNVAYEPNVALWRHLPAEAATVAKSVVKLNGAEIWPSSVNDMPQETARFINGIIRIVHGVQKLAGEVDAGEETGAHRDSPSG